MKYQVKINDNNDTTFTSENGKFQKIWDNDKGFMMSHSYKTEKGFVNAIKKVITSESKIVAWNEDGTPNTEFKL